MLSPESRAMALQAFHDLGYAREIEPPEDNAPPPHAEIPDGANAPRLVVPEATEVMEAPASGGDLIVSSAKFLDGFVPPDYLIDGLVQRRFCYSFTARTGDGKTVIALLIAASVALGRPIAGREIDPGRVLYLVGENPDDVRMRWLVLSEQMGFNPDDIDVFFLPGTAKLSEPAIAALITAKVKEIGGVSLVVVDTSAAYYEGDEENGNVQAGAHARLLRKFVTLPGEPCVVILCHPVKNATQDNLLPRGGGAFTAEVDGNLTGWKTDNSVALHWQGKFRGPDFAPITFELETVTSPKLRDSKGRLIPSVIAKVPTEQELKRSDAHSRSDEDALLLAIADNERASFSGLAVALGWITSSGENKSKVKRCAARLKADKLVDNDRRGTLCLTKKGDTEVTRLRKEISANERRVTDT